MGTVNYGANLAWFDNLRFWSTSVQCGTTAPAVGVPVSIVPCSLEVGDRATSQWNWNPLYAGSPTGTFSLVAAPQLCIATTPNTTIPGTNPWPVTLQPCDHTNVYQQWSQNYTQLYDSTLSNVASGRCLDIFQQAADIGDAIDAWPCNGQQWYYDYTEGGEIISIENSICLGVC